jgi:hypothetical protein
MLNKNGDDPTSQAAEREGLFSGGSYLSLKAHKSFQFVC